MTRADHIRQLLEEYERQRTLNQKQADDRLTEAGVRDPRIPELREQNALLALSGMKNMLRYDNQADREAEMARVREAGLKNNKEIRARLKALGLPETYLEVQYRCPICKDTGYVGEAPSRFCECFEHRLVVLMHEDGTMAGTDRQNFAAFNPGFIPDEPIDIHGNTQRSQLMRVKDEARKYAETFPFGPYKNFVLMGESGLGKTFLLNCIYAQVIERGYSAIRITAYRMFEAMRKHHLSNDPAYDGFTSLVETPLLLIDDLGTEPMMKNITREYLFMLLNERAAGDRHTAIATNLTPQQVRETYGERVSSRMFDRGRGIAIQLKGKDLRTK